MADFESQISFPSSVAVIGRHLLIHILFNSVINGIKERFVDPTFTKPMDH